MMPKAVPVAPLGLRAKQCHADADVDTAAAIVAPTNIATRKRLIIALSNLYASHSRLRCGGAATTKLLVVFIVFQTSVRFLHDAARQVRNGSHASKPFAS
jgi:hypothetical protein